MAPEVTAQNTDNVADTTNATQTTNAAEGVNSTNITVSNPASTKLFSTKKINVTLDDHNYLLWHQQVYLTIKTQRLLKFIDDNVQLPVKYITQSGVVCINPEFELFEEQDGALATWLLSTVSESVLPNLIGLSTASDIWNTRHRLYSSKTTSRLMSYRRLLHTQKKGDLTMHEYLMKIKSVCDNLASSGERISEQEHITAILNGLSSDYDSVITVITASPSSSDLSFVSSILLDAEARHSNPIPSISASAHVVTQHSTSTQGSTPPHPSAPTQHSAPLPPNNSVESTEHNVEAHVVESQESSGYGYGRGRGGRGRNSNFNRPQCQLCGRLGHLAERCYYRFDMQFKYNMDNIRPTSSTPRSFTPAQANTSVFTAPFQPYQSSFQQPSVQFVQPQPQMFHTGSSVLQPQPVVYPSNQVRFVSPVSVYPSAYPSLHPQFSSVQQSQPAGQNVHQATPQIHLVTSDVVDDNSWFPDSGATHHLTNDITNLQTATYPGSGSVQVGNGSILPIKCSGQSSFLSGSRNFKLNNLLFVPNITKNLLSVSKFTQDNQVSLEFFPTHCQARDLHSGQILLTGSEANGLYKLDMSLSGHLSKNKSVAQSQNLLSFNKVVNTAAVSSPKYSLSSVKLCNKFSLDVWHSRLGHPSSSVLHQVLKSCNIPFNSNKDQNAISLCQACQLGKAHKLPFSDFVTTYSAPLQLVVADVWGPAPMLSSGYKYYVAFTDVFSRYTWLYFLKYKSQVNEAFVQFHLQVERQLGVQLKIFQSDGGGEFAALKSYFLSHGIVHRLSCPHTSEQNGLVERKHRQIVEVGLTLLAQASVPLKYWQDAFSTAIFLINRLPSSALSGISPYQALFLQKPDYTFLRIFGCVCYPLLRPYNNHKFQFRSSPCTFLGYSPAHKGYKCVDVNGRIYISRHVKFDESVFPFSSDCSSSASKNVLPSVAVFYLFQCPSESVPPPSSSNPSVSLPHVPICNYPCLAELQVINSSSNVAGHTLSKQHVSGSSNPTEHVSNLVSPASGFVDSSPILGFVSGLQSSHGQHHHDFIQTVPSHVSSSQPTSPQSISHAISTSTVPLQTTSPHSISHAISTSTIPLQPTSPQPFHLLYPPPLFHFKLHLHTLFHMLYPPPLFHFKLHLHTPFHMLYPPPLFHFNLHLHIPFHMLYPPPLFHFILHLHNPFHLLYPPPLFHNKLHLRTLQPLFLFRIDILW
ncbi:hypothetical protein HRI_000174600 [Hibiscus trionum]|uniref:Integrase catalytic domain-containing protein n=1 Tax=Hibiscus trionum TaxID=183268 RepID=A0A9W7GTL2_HIBTR|nr:hypothetical protein HRI_000174600 [Hibiscus trionum]